MSAKLGYNMANSFVLRPKDLQAAHDMVQLKAEIKDAAKLREDFAAAMKSISRNLDFEMDNMIIIVPSSPDEIVAEGHALRTCVGTGGYIERVVRRECIILFLRRCEDVSKPFYTVEVDVHSRKAVQVRGMQNAGMTADVRSFMDRFERDVLMAA